MFKFRGQLNNKQVVDIIDFEGEFAICDQLGKIHIDEFNTIFYPTVKFKLEVLNIIDEVKEVEVVKTEMFVKPVKKNI